MIKKALLSLFAFVILATVLMFVKTYLDTNKFEKTKDTREFALTFNPDGKQPVQMEVRNGSWRNAFYDWHIKSTLFPYKRLEMETIKQSDPVSQYKNGQIIDLSPEGRSIYKDNIWNVFWIGIKPANQGNAPTLYYGPFKIEE